MINDNFTFMIDEERERYHKKEKNEMAIVPFKPDEGWADAKTKFVSFVLIGVMATFFVLIFVSPILSINLVTETGTQLGKYAKQVTDISCGGVMDAVELVGSVVNGLGGGIVSTISTMTTQAVLAVEVIAGALQSITGIILPLGNLLTGGISELLKAVQMATGYVQSLLGEAGGFATNAIGSISDLVGPFFDNFGQVMEFFVTNAFTPAMKAFSGVRTLLADKIETFTKSQIPSLIGAFNTLLSTAQSQIFSDTGVAILTLVLSFYIGSINKVVGIFTNGKIVEDLISTVVNMIGTIGDSIGELLTFDFCDTIVNFIEPALSLLDIPGAGNLNDCKSEFVKLGLWYMTNGSFCAGTPVSDFTGCLFGQIGNVVIIPAYSFNVSARDIWDGSFPSLASYILRPIEDLARDLINSLPDVTLGWPDITLQTIFVGLEVLLNNIFTSFKGIFVSSVNGSLVSLMPVVPPRVPLPIILLYTIFKVAQRFLDIAILQVGNAIISAAETVNDSWSGCVSYSDSITSWLPWPLDDIVEFFEVTWCVTDIIGSVSFMYNSVRAILQTTVDTFFNINSVMSNLLGSIPGLSADPSFVSSIDSAITTALDIAPTGSIAF